MICSWPTKTLRKLGEDPFEEALRAWRSLRPGWAALLDRSRTRVESGARAIPGILSALEAAGIAVESVTSHRPSLDDVYLHYTGRDFSTEDEEGKR